MKYLVIATEHDTSFSNEPMVIATFDNKNDANAYVSKVVNDSIADFPDEEREGHNLVCCYNKHGERDYGCVWTVIEVADGNEGLCNKYGVPVQIYTLQLQSGKTKTIDISVEEEWGYIQNCAPNDCDDWKYSVGYGNDMDGHDKIISVSAPNGDRWEGNADVMYWFDTRIAPYERNYGV